MDRPEQLSTGQQVNKETLLQQYLIIGKETLGLTVTQPYSGKPAVLCLMERQGSFARNSEVKIEFTQLLFCSAVNVFSLKSK